MTASMTQDTPDLTHETTAQYARRMMGVDRPEPTEYAPEDCPGCGTPTKHGGGERCGECKGDLR